MNDEMNILEVAKRNLEKVEKYQIVSAEMGIVLTTDQKAHINGMIKAFTMTIEYIENEG